MKNPRVAIVIVIWNGRDDTVECLESFRADTYPAKEIIVVDNGSSDDSAAVIRDRFPEVTLIATGANLGFTGGNNVGIRYALDHGADYIYLLNNDTTVEPAALSALVEAAEANPQYGMVAPVMHYFDPPRDIWFAGAGLDLAHGRAYHDHKRQPARTAAIYETEWITGCAMLLPANVMRNLKGFDDRYYLTWEDVDLSLRVRESGHSLAVVPAARIYHKCARSGVRLSKVSKCCHYYSVRNSLLVVRLHAGRQYRRAAARIIITFLFRCLNPEAEHGTRMDYLSSVIDAVKDHFTGNYGPRKNRL